MKFTILQQDLLPILQSVSRSCGVRATLPVLNNLLLSVEGKRLKVAATNLEVGVIKSISIIEGEDGEITIPAKILVDLISGLGSSQIDLQTEGEILTISSGRFKASINGISASEFPAIPLAKDAGISFPKKAFLASSDILFAKAVDEGRPVLTGILTEIKGVKLDLVATDGFRLAHRQVVLSESAKDGRVEGFRSLIPGKTFEEILKIISESDVEEVKVAVSENQNQVIFNLGQSTVSSRLIEGQFPSWEKIIPKEIISRVLIDKDVLLRAIKLAAVFIRSEANTVILTTGILTTGESGITIKSQAKELGSQENEIEAEISGENLQVAFNTRFLLDAVSHIPTTQVMMEFSGSLSASLIKPIGEEGLEFIVMPVRLS